MMKKKSISYKTIMTDDLITKELMKIYKVYRNQNMGSEGHRSGFPKKVKLNSSGAVRRTWSPVPGSPEKGMRNLKDWTRL